MGRYLHAQNTLYVKKDGSGSMNGQSWANAYGDLAKALSEAAYGDQVWVAKGIYRFDKNADRSSSFQLKNGVKVFGGFIGGESSTTERNWAENETVLSGEIGEPGYKDNVFHVVYGRGLDSTTILDGFSITAGYAVDDFPANRLDSEGAGLLLLGSAAVSNGRPLIQNCRVFQNAASYGGGASFSWSDPGRPETGQYPINPVLVNCTFERNYALYDGGGILKRGSMPAEDTFALVNCVLVENRAKQGAGGGLYLSETGNAKLRLDRCLFERDSALDGGGVFFLSDPIGFHNRGITLLGTHFIENYAIEGSGFYYTELLVFPSVEHVSLKTIIEDCVFENNKTSNGKGPIFFYKGEHGNHHFIMRNTRINGNKTVGSTSMITIQSDRFSVANILIDHCSFVNNGRITGSGSSLTLNMGYGQFCHANHEINNCLFSGNSAGIGSLTPEQVYVKTSITNCTFYRNGRYIFNNSWHLPFLTTDTIYNKMTISNCIIEEPVSNQLYMFYDNDPLENFILDEFRLNNCMVSLKYPPVGTSQSWAISNFFGVNPQFRDTLNGDLRLQSCSPAIGAGANQYTAMAGIVSDLDGVPRILFKNVDLGAYESEDSCGISNTELPDYERLEKLHISPNPSPDGQVQINLPSVDLQTGLIRVFDLLGKERFCTRFSKEQIDLSSLPQGTYLICLQAKNAVYIGKWVRY